MTSTVGKKRLEEEYKTYVEKVEVLHVEGLTYQWCEEECQHGVCSLLTSSDLLLLQPTLTAGT